jgi:methylmalonyl-CoA/ethylmalonyl-CoA epimerase
MPLVRRKGQAHRLGTPFNATSFSALIADCGRMEEGSHMTRSPPGGLPSKPSLEQLRKQAKALHRKCRDGDVQARGRLETHLKRPTDDRPVTLADAHFVIAREHGFDNWSAMKAKVEQVEHQLVHVGTRRTLSDHSPKIRTNAMNNRNILGHPRIAQILLTSADLDEAERFYGELLGLPLVDQALPVMKWFGCGGVNLLLHKDEAPKPVGYVYFAVPGEPGRIDQTYAELKSAGVDVKQPPHCIAKDWHGHDVWLAFFDDPWGNHLALISDVPVAKA